MSKEYTTLAEQLKKNNYATGWFGNCHLGDVEGEWAQDREVILGSVSLYGQQKITVTGQVTDEGNTPLPGAKIIIEGTNIGAVTKT